MDHSEARDRLLDLALEPARLRAFDRQSDLVAPELRAHLAGCAECRAELESWRATVAALDTAVSTAPTIGAAPAGSLRNLSVDADAAGVALPQRLRARTLAAARARPALEPAARESAAPEPVDSERNNSPVAAMAAARRLRGAMNAGTWLAIAAALVVVVAGAALVVDRTQQLDSARTEAAALGTVTASLDRILQDPDHKVASLTTSTGASAGSVSWSVSQGSVVVLAEALQSPPPGHVYRCWIEQGATRVAVGEMQFSSSIAYWAGSVDSWSVAFAPGSRFGMSLESIGGGTSGTPVLVGSL